MFQNCWRSKNLSLYWDKYVFLENRQALVSNQTSTLPSEILKELNYVISTQANDGSLKQIIDRFETQREAIVQKFKGKDMLILDIKMELRTRLLIGSGVPSVLEVGMCLSRNYGIPIIPSSSIKGTFSNYSTDKKIFSQEEHLKIFGENIFEEDKNEKGRLLFLDAYPTNLSRLKFGLDIVNNHFQPYYMDGKIPNDWYNPVPVQYLTVSQGIFRFTILSEEKIDGELKAKIKQEFINMLKSYGIGAKTSYGYGRFREEQGYHNK